MTRAVVVMGVAGCGKSTLGRASRNIWAGPSWRATCATRPKMSPA